MINDGGDWSRESGCGCVETGDADSGLDRYGAF